MSMAYMLLAPAVSEVSCRLMVRCGPPACASLESCCSCAVAIGKGASGASGRSGGSGRYHPQTLEGVRPVLAGLATDRGATQLIAMIDKCDYGIQT